MQGLLWGEDLQRDCAELRRLERWGLYAPGHHDQHCPIEHFNLNEKEESR